MEKKEVESIPERSQTPPPEYEQYAGPSTSQPNNSQSSTGDVGFRSALGNSVKDNFVSRLRTPQEAGLIGSALSLTSATVGTTLGLTTAAIGGVLSLPAVAVGAGVKYHKNKQKQKQRESSSPSSSSSSLDNSNRDGSEEDLKRKQARELKEFKESQKREKEEWKRKGKGKDSIS
ncbi:hypothetical protein E3Q05_00187 [Wallemia mellicola]|nr:hypothetical protein E3Q05_00187 [Wallemia mellicola]